MPGFGEVASGGTGADGVAVLAVDADGGALSCVFAGEWHEGSEDSNQRCRRTWRPKLEPQRRMAWSMWRRAPSTFSRIHGRPVA
jgi:hypothetical protein